MKRPVILILLCLAWLGVTEAAATPRRSAPGTQARQQVPRHPGGHRPLPVERTRALRTGAASADSLVDWIRTITSNLVASDDRASTLVADPSDGSLYVAGSAESDFLIVKYTPSGDTIWTARFVDPGTDGGIPAAMSIDSSGNVLITGMSSDDYTTVKYSSSGLEQWVRRYNGPEGYDDQPTAMTVDASGNVYVTGSSYSSLGGYDIATVKYSPGGAQLWSARYNGTGSDDDAPAGIGVDSLGNVYVTGYATSADFNYDDVTLKYNVAGLQQWAALYDGPGHDEDQAAGLTVDRAGNVTVTGFSVNENFNRDCATIRYSPSGLRKWVARYNGIAELDDQGTGVVTDEAGGAIVTASSIDPFNAQTIVTLRYSSAGAEQWAVSYSGSGDNIPVSILPDRAGGAFIAAEADETGLPSKLLTLHYSSNGSLAWSRIYADPGGGNAQAVGCAYDGSGNVYTGGAAPGSGITSDFLTVNYGPLGLEHWAVRYDGPRHSEDEALAAVADHAGHVYVTGLSFSSATGGDVLTVKYDTAGLPLWSVRYNGPADGFDAPASIAADSAGNVYVACSSEGQLTSSDYAILKYNAAGTLLWTQRVNGPDSLADEPAALELDPAGNVYVSGRSVGAATGGDILTVKYAPSGTQLWAVRYDGPAHASDGGTALVVGPAGTVYVAGFSFDPASNSDAITLKYSTAGAQQWARRYNGPANKADHASAIALDESENVYVAGASEGSGTQEDLLVVKYDASGAQQWVTTRNGPGNGNDRAIGLAVDGERRLLVAGFTRGSAGNDEITTMKLDSSGAQLWSAAAGGLGSAGSYPSDLLLDPSGNIVVAGYGDDPAGRPGFVVLKYDRAGRLLARGRYAAATLDPPLAARTGRMAADAHGNIYLPGAMVPTVTSSDWTTVRFRATQTALHLSSSAVAFGSKDITCGPRSEVVTATNAGSEQLFVDSVSSDNQNFSVTPTHVSLPPGGSVGFTLSFTPGSIGPQAGHVLFAYAAASAETIAVSGSGTGTGAEITLPEEFGTGWQLISLPVRQACTNVPGDLFAYGSSYLRTDSLLPGKGYWKKFFSPGMRFIGYPVEAETIVVRAGWNIVGSISTPVQTSALGQLPLNNLSSLFFGYAGSYFAADTIRPGHAYWVKARQNGSLILRHALAAEQATLPLALPSQRSLTIEDAAGNAQRLYLDDRPEIDPEEYLLPPLPPDRGFDARFLSGRMVESSAGEGRRELPLLVTTAAYPVTIRWEMTGLGRRALLRYGTGETPLTGQGSVILNGPPERLSVLLNVEQTVPTAFALHQNYPNPFNPSTVIRYDLPAESRVLLRLFNTLGQEVATLVRELQSAGAHTHTFHTTLPSGLYVYRLEAAPTRYLGATFLASRKMLLLR